MKIKSKFVNAFMATAENFAQLSSAKRAQVGAIIVKNDRIISIGYNGMPSGWTNECETTQTLNDVPHMRQDYISRGFIMHQGGDSITWTKQSTKPEVLHAEANAIAKVAQSNESSTGASIFCTHMPCIECAKLIHQAGITEVYYRIPYEAAKGSGREFLEKSNISLHHVEATNGQN